MCAWNAFHELAAATAVTAAAAMAGAVATAPAAAAHISQVMTEGYLGLLALALQHYILDPNLKNTHDGGLLVSDRPPNLLAIKAITRKGRYLLIPVARSKVLAVDIRITSPVQYRKLKHAGEFIVVDWA